MLNKNNKIISICSDLQYSQDQIDKLNSVGNFAHHDVSKLPVKDVIDIIGDANILILGASGVEEISAEVFNRCSSLKFISVLGSGTDFIDKDAAKEHGVQISNLKGANSQSVAEHTWGLIFNLSKKIQESYEGLEKEEYSFAPYIGIELQGKTLGVIGFGEIGRRVAKIGTSLDMNVIAYSRTKKNLADVSDVEFDELIRTSDVIVLSLPYGKDTHDLITGREISQMKDNVIIVSPSREDIISRDHIFEAIESGKVFGYGQELDINTAPDSRYFKYDNAIATPHTAFFTHESEEKSNNMGVENVMKYVAGGPQNLVI